MSDENILITGEGEVVFTSDTQNFGPVETTGITFDENANNSGVIYNPDAGMDAWVSFLTNSTNSAPISTNATIKFDENATNTASVDSTQEVIFTGNSINQSDLAVTGDLIFAGDSSTTGILQSDNIIVFEDSATNDATIIADVLFKNEATNNGTVTGDAEFTQKAINSPTATINGDANFSGFTQNQGIISGDIQIEDTAINSGTVNGDTTVYDIERSGAYGFGYFTNDEIDPSFTITTPMSVLDDNKYFIFSQGQPSAAMGCYSNYFFDSYGNIGTEYFATRPLSAQDDGKFYTVSAGQVTIGHGYYSNYKLVNGEIDINYTDLSPKMTGEKNNDNILYYGYQNGVAVEPYNGEKGINYVYLSMGVFASTYGLIDGVLAWRKVKEITVYSPRTVEDNNLYYTFNSGDSQIANGAYVDNYFTNGEIDVTYTNSLPQSAKDSVARTFGSDYRVVYENGVASSAMGYYSNGYYIAGYKETVNEPKIQESLDNNTFYWYASTNISLANGGYSNGYYINGVRALQYTNLTPVSAIDNQQTYVTFLSGYASPAEGAYSTGVFYSGQKQLDYNSTNPIQTIDDNLYYNYVNGTPILANGCINNYLYTDGVMGEYCS